MFYLLTLNVSPGISKAKTEVKKVKVCLTFEPTIWLLWSNVPFNEPVLVNWEIDWWFSIRIGILLPKLFWPTVRKKCSSDWEKLLKFQAEGREFQKFWDHYNNLFSNSERSEQFLVTECFFNLLLEVSKIL